MQKWVKERCKSTLRLQFEAICQRSEQERQVVTELLDGMIIKYQTRLWNTSREQAVK
jgi:hypothetical protein